MLSWEELNALYPMARYEMTEAQERDFVEKCCELYETEIAKTFWTPYEQYKSKIGLSFSVVRRLTESDGYDIEALPGWKILLSDGDEISAWPEEICRSDRVANGGPEE